MKKIFQFPRGVHANYFDAAVLVTAPMWVIREAAGACMASEAGRQTFQRVCLIVVHALIAGEVDADSRRHEIEGLTEAAARQRALELLDLVFEVDAPDAARSGGA